MKISIPILKCKRCGHKWAPRQAVVTICPQCKTAGWESRKAGRQGLRTDLERTATRVAVRTRKTANTRRGRKGR